MQTRFYFQKIDETNRGLLENYLSDKKLSRLTRLLQHGSLELAKLVVNVKYHQRHNTFIVRLGLKIIRHDLNAEEKSKNLLEAFDLALDDVIIQLRKIENQMHKR